MERIRVFIRRRVIKQMKPTPTQKKKLYALLHEIVRLRDGAKCLKCGRTDKLQLSHIYPKGRYKLMEYLLGNVKLLCLSCHLFWWHKNPIEAHEWLSGVVSKERLAYLKLCSNTYLGKFDPKLAIIELTQELKQFSKRK